MARPLCLVPGLPHAIEFVEKIQVDTQVPWSTRRWRSRTVLVSNWTWTPLLVGRHAQTRTPVQFRLSDDPARLMGSVSRWRVCDWLVDLGYLNAPLTPRRQTRGQSQGKGNEMKMPDADLQACVGSCSPAVSSSLSRHSSSQCGVVPASLLSFPLGNNCRISLSGAHAHIYAQPGFSSSPLPISPGASSSSASASFISSHLVFSSSPLLPPPSIRQQLML